MKSSRMDFERSDHNEHIECYIERTRAHIEGLSVFSEKRASTTSQDNPAVLEPESHNLEIPKS
jgi:hypothetical protein